MARHVWDVEVGDCMMCGVMQTLENNKKKCHWKRLAKEHGVMGYYKDGKWYDDKGNVTGTSSYNSNGVGGSYTSTTYKSKCVGHDADAVLDFKGMLVTGFAKKDLPLRGDKKVLVVNLTGNSIGAIEWPLKKLPESLNLLDAKETYGIDMGEEALIDWPDRGAVALKPAFWLDMLNMAKEKGFERMNVCCFGGHGRTGTALACMLVAAHAVKNGDEAVDLVRKIHCEECIESNAQLDYIDYVCSYYKLPKTKAAQAS